MGQNLEHFENVSSEAKSIGAKKIILSEKKSISMEKHKCILKKHFYHYL
jgi:hypothetical protein